MKSWLAYVGAFACAVGAAMLCYVWAFSVVMRGAGYGIAGFVLLAVILPVTAGLAVFGVTHFAFTKQRFDALGWAYAIALVAVATAASFGMIVANVLQEPVAALVLVVTTFVGGGWMIQRTADA